eukprot:scaffold271024_cov46-Prasinocladus_malaysianus.AAC.2
MLKIAEADESVLNAHIASLQGCTMTRLSTHLEVKGWPLESATSALPDKELLFTVQMQRIRNFARSEIGSQSKFALTLSILVGSLYGLIQSAANNAQWTSSSTGTSQGSLVMPKPPTGVYAGMLTKIYSGYPLDQQALQYVSEVEASMTNLRDVQGKAFSSSVSRIRPKLFLSSEKFRNSVNSMGQGLLPAQPVDPSSNSGTARQKVTQSSDEVVTGKMSEETASTNDMSGTAKTTGQSTATKTVWRNSGEDMQKTPLRPSYASILCPGPLQPVDMNKYSADTNKPESLQRLQDHDMPRHATSTGNGKPPLKNKRNARNRDRYPSENMPPEGHGKFEPKLVSQIPIKDRLQRPPGHDGPWQASSDGSDTKPPPKNNR